MRPMMRLLPIVLITATLGACAPQRGPMRDRPLAPNPSAFLTADMAFARLAQEKGMWTAFRDTAAKDAVLFVPQRTNALEALKTRADPPVAAKWQPHRVVAACDGSAGVTTGMARDPDGGQYAYTTAWVRDLDGRIRWVLNHRFPVAAPRPSPEFLSAETASCQGRPGVEIMARDEGDDVVVGLSRDQTLSWESVVRPDGSRTITIRRWNGTTMEPAIVDRVAVGN